MRATILSRLRDLEQQYKAIRNRPIIGAHALRLETTQKSYTPAKRGKRMICLSSLKTLRKTFISWYQTCVTQARSWYAAWKAGERDGLPPPGMFAPGGALFSTPELDLKKLDTNNAMRYYTTVIKSFKCKQTEKVFKREISRRIPFDITRQVHKKLLMLDAASELRSLQIPPSNRLEKLRGLRSGQYSIRVNDQWRICFVWRGKDAYEVEVVDYH